MSSGQTLVVSVTVDSDVSLDVLAELVTDSGEDLSLTGISHGAVGEVGVHSGTVPVTWDWLGGQVHCDVVLLTETHHEVTRDPDLVTGSLGALVENLVLPGAEHDLSIGALDVETGIDADVQMFVHDVSSRDSSGADTAVVGSLWSWEELTGWPSDWVASGVVDEDVLLFETEPEVVVVIIDLRAGVGSVWGTIWVHDFAHDHEGVSSAWIVADVDWDEETVGAVSWSLLGGGAVEAPFGAVLKFS